MSSLRRTHSPARATSAGIIGVFALALAGAPPALADAGVGDRASEFRKVVDAEGSDVEIGDYRGKVVVVTFGASWCPPCKKELPAFERLAARYASRDAEVAFIAVNVDSELSSGKEFMNKFDLEHVRAAFNPDRSTVRLYQPPAMPTTYVIGKGGLIRRVHKGYSTGDEKEIHKAVDPLL